MAQYTALSVFAVPGPVHTFAPKTPAQTAVACDVVLYVGSAALVLDCGLVPVSVAVDESLAVSVVSPALVVDGSEEDLILLCPY